MSKEYIPSELKNQLLAGENLELQAEIKQLREENKRLRFAIENGLGPEDLEDDRKGGGR